MPRPAIPAKGYRALRAYRTSLPGHAYLLTTATHRRERFFSDFLVARLAVGALNDEKTLAGSTLQVWVLMPDHLHVLVQLGDDDHLSSLMNRIKSRIGRMVNR